MPNSSIINSSESIAIIGLGCRFPGGANSPQQYWSLLSEGRDAISTTPEDRWDLTKFFSPGGTKPGKTNSKWGGYVDAIDRFDPQLFGISPREAAAMDPQQRMLMEVAWQAFEDSGLPIESIRGQPASVFIGISSFDYSVASLSFEDRTVLGPYSNTGGSNSIAANRISYCFDLRGPSVAVDTACSSSLVALHMACESLRRGDSTMALAGGVNALLLPDFYVAFSQLGVLSPDGRCKTFDARANGYVRSEGAGIVVLKPYDAALRDGDDIYCVIRSTALNQDGHTDGMTVPSQRAQEELMHQAYRSAGVDPRLVSYIEAHGTGTPVGDPIEAAAIGRVIGKSRDASQPCYLGSVKTNIGHLEAGAGIASVIKVALAMRHQLIPRHLNFESLNPAIELSEHGLQLPLQNTEWQPIEGRRIAGVNGFGYGGANAHVVIEQVAQEQQSDAHIRVKAPASQSSLDSSFRGSQIGWPLPISAQSHEQLPVVAKQWADWLSQHEEATTVSKPEIALAAGATERVSSLPSVRDLVGAAIAQRSHLRTRRIVFGSTIRSLAEELRKTVADHSASNNVISDQGRQQGILFACCGQGPQHWKMGRRLYAAGGAFKETIDRCDREFSRHVAWSLISELHRSESESRFQQTSIAQPALFAIQVALAAQWADYGVRPTAIIGHSVGEIAAAHLSGALSFEHACTVAIHRGRTMDLATSRGAMIAAGISADEARELICGREQLLSLAAVNGPRSVTISGDADAIGQVANQLQARGAFCRQLAVEYAFHSPQMEPVEKELKRALSGITARVPTTAMISTVTGGLVTEAITNADYWWRNVRHGVLFAPAMEVAAKQGFEVAIELGPHPVLSYAINECFAESGKPIQVVPSMYRDVDDVQAFRDAVERLYQLDAPVDWKAIATKPRCRVRLPHYPMQRQSLWAESDESRRTRLQTDYHPLLGTRSGEPELSWQNQVSTKTHPYFVDHQVRHRCLYPAAAMIETALAVAVRTSPTSALDASCLRLENAQLHQPLVLDGERLFDLSITYKADRDRIELRFKEQRPRSVQNPADDWHDLATIGIRKDDSPFSAQFDLDSFDLNLVQQRCSEQVTQQRCYDYCDRLGLNYGEQFQGLVSGYRCDGESLVDVRLADTLRSEANQFVIHPALLDACFHAMIVADAHFDQTLDDLYLPYRIEKVLCRGDLQGLTECRVHAQIRDKNAARMIADLTLVDSSGAVVLHLRGFESRNAGGAASLEAATELMYRYRWESDSQSPSQPTTGPKRRWLVFADGQGLADLLCERQHLFDHDVYHVRPGTEFRKLAENQFQINPTPSQAWDELLHSIPFDSITDVVYAWGLDLASDQKTLSAAEVEQSSQISCEAPLALVQAWQRRLEDDRAEGNKTTPRLAIVTVQAQSLDDQAEPVQFCQTPLIGIGRVLISEFAGLRTRLIDLSDDSADEQLVDLVRELFIDDAEDEVLYRGGNRQVRRFMPHSTMPLPKKASTPPRTDGDNLDGQLLSSCRLAIGQTSSIADLRYTVSNLNQLRPADVLIKVHAAGLNFSDVMKALDLYPGLPDGPVMFGAECCGTILRVGDAVTDWKVGDEVIAIAKGSFGTHAVVDQALVANKPQTLTPEQAATVPIAFLTADYALNQCARLRAGESVLIHSASGGVGLAAIQLAKQNDLLVHATAGSDQKRNYVRSLGIDSVWDSRSLEFADQIRCYNKSKGVDAILNSLPGAAIRKGLELLNTGGRFLEIGKRDIYGDRAIDLLPFRNNLAFFAIDLDQLFTTCPQRMGDDLRRIAALFDDGTLTALPVKSFDADDTADAFRFMQQAKHIGKVVVSYPKAPQKIYPTANNGRLRLESPVTSAEAANASSRQRKEAADLAKPLQNLFHADKTYWIAGGLGGFGLQIARWMARGGAGHLVLSGRSASPSDHAMEAISEIEASGTSVTVMPADITKPSDVASTLKFIRDKLPPLRGIYHTAMVLEDRLLTDLDLPTLHRVLRPKVLGGWNLHAATLDQSLITEPLDQFVLFSSLSSIFGHAGQANYAAANAALDGLAYNRRSQGLPALVVNWGHLGEVGYLAEREELGARLERQGVLSFSVQQATDCLDDLLRSGAIQASVLKMDWTLWRGLGLTQEVSPRFAHLIRRDASELNQTFDINQLRLADSSEQLCQIQRLLINKLMSLLGLRSDQLEPTRSLLELGLDSLMAVELRNWIENQLQITLPISELMRGGSIEDISLKAAMLISDAESTLPEETAIDHRDTVLNVDDPTQLLESIDQLDDGQVDRLLAELTRQSTPPEPAS